MREISNCFDYDQDRNLSPEIFYDFETRKRLVFKFLFYTSQMLRSISISYHVSTQFFKNINIY